MTRSVQNKTRRSERGVALFVAIFTVLLITAIGAGMIMLTNTDTSITSNFRDEQTAYFAAKAGVEEIRDRLRTSANGSLTSPANTFFTAGAMPGAANGVLYIVNPSGGEQDKPWLTTGTAYPDDEICAELANGPVAYRCNSGVPTGSWYITTVPTANASYAPTAGGVLPWKWARITAKTNLTSSGTSNGTATQNAVDGNLLNLDYRICWTGSQQIAISNALYASCTAYPVTPAYQPVYVITALAVTPSGSRRMVQAETTATVFPTLPGPMIFDGADPQLGVTDPRFSTPSSNAFSVSGIDQAKGQSNGVGCPVAHDTGALGGYDANSTTALTTDASGSRASNYTGASGTGSPSVTNIGSALGNLATVGGLETLVSDLTLVAGNEGNTYGNNPSSINPGTSTNPVVNVVNGDLTLNGGFTGYGIILVTGTLTFQGNPTFNGLILVIGKGNVVKNGGGNGTVDGSMLIANLYDSSGNLLPPSSSPGIPSLNWSGGGTVQWNYDSCWSQSLNQLTAWRIVGMREIIR